MGRHNRPRNGRQKNGLGKNKNTGGCKFGGPGHGKGNRRGNGKGRKS